LVEKRHNNLIFPAVTFQNRRKDLVLWVGQLDIQISVW
jgi:hypothetical protein